MRCLAVKPSALGAAGKPSFTFPKTLRPRSPPTKKNVDVLRRTLNRLPRHDIALTRLQSRGLQIDTRVMPATKGQFELLCSG